MKKFSKETIKWRAKRYYETLIPCYGLANTKAIIRELTKLLNAETKRRKELKK